MGIIYFLLYYSSFKYLILKYNFKTLGRSNNGKLLLQQDEKNFDVLTASKVIDGFNQQFYYIVKGLVERITLNIWIVEIIGLLMILQR